MNKIRIKGSFDQVDQQAKILSGTEKIVLYHESSANFIIDKETEVPIKCTNLSIG